MAQADVSYSVKVRDPIAPGTTGLAYISIGKDREGSVREHAIDRYRAGALVVDAEETDRVHVRIASPTPDKEPDRMMIRSSRSRPSR